MGASAGGPARGPGAVPRRATGVHAFSVGTPAARFAFTDRRGGVSPPPYDGRNLGRGVGDDDAAVLENRRRTARELGLDPGLVLWMRQVHGSRTVVATGPWQGKPPEADGLVTGRPGLALAVLVADCTPVLLADPGARVVAAAHAGRPGLARGIVPAVVERMTELGARPEDVVAATGPAICGSCYEVPEELQDAVAGVVPEARATTRWGTPALDVPGGVWAQLRSAGVTRGERSHICTLESPDHYTYRGDGRTGRFAGYVWLEA
ncbi:MAG: peptidoglycan editing factor PgeF [Carbonactinosporaceae bacterium]